MTENVAIRDVEQELARLREEMSEPGAPPSLRASSLTAIAWVPPAWEEEAFETLGGLGERHPSRGIVLLPRPEADRDELDAEVDVRCFLDEGLGREVCSEVIVLRLNGPRAGAPASVVAPLLISDLPVFLRWRGALPFGDPVLEQLVSMVDHVIVDSGEWENPVAGYALLSGLLDAVAVSDLAWSRTEPWRRAVAALWPDIADAAVVRVLGPEPEALLLGRWVGVRLGRDVALDWKPSDHLEAVGVDGREAEAREQNRRSASDLLSAHYDLFGRDDVYEQVVRSFSAREPGKAQSGHGHANSDDQSV